MIRGVALTASAVTFLYSCVLLARFDPTSSGVQFFESHAWHGRLGSAFALGVDGLSLPMVLLSTLLMLVAILASGRVANQGDGHARGASAKLYYFLLLTLETALLGVFLARDWSLFYVFWELTLIPLFLLIERMGGVHRQRAALNFVLYTMGGSVFLLISLLTLYDASPNHSFDMTAIASGIHSLPYQTQGWIFLGLLIGFGVKMPIFPLHGWLPLAHVEAPSPVSILLSGALLKMGAYGLLRAVQTLPEAVASWQGILATLGLINLLYGGVLAWRQRDLKAMVAYSSISHMGVVLIGIASLNRFGLIGAVAQMVTHGLTAGALFLLIGLLYERTHTRDIGDYSSLSSTMPRFAFFTIFTFLAAVGLPGTAGFISEFYTLVGGFALWGGWMALLSIGMLISAAYALRTISRLFSGPVSTKMDSYPDLTYAEMSAAGALSLATLVLGLFPMLGLSFVIATVERLVASF